MKTIHSIFRTGINTQTEINSKEDSVQPGAIKGGPSGGLWPLMEGYYQAPEVEDPDIYRQGDILIARGVNPG